MSNKIAIITPKFLSFDGVSCPMGGGERVMVDLCNLLKENDLDPHVFQLATTPFKNVFKCIPVNGIVVEMFISVHFPRRVLQPILDEISSRDDFDHIIYFNMQCYPIGGYKPEIVISHGVYWDRIAPSEHRDIANTQISEAVKNNFLVSVDANTLNVIQSTHPELMMEQSRDRTEIIPNYVDLDVFNEAVPVAHSPLTVTFPRRLTYPRGYELAISAADTLLESFGPEDLRFKFAGSGQPEDILKIDKLKAKYGSERCLHVSYDMDEAFRIYADSDICIIPTLHSEGTSLSALESMACGIPVISTRVGGLAEIIIPGFTGFEIKPTVESLTNVITEVIWLLNKWNGSEEITRIRETAISLARTFSMDRWKISWTNVLKKVGWIQ